MATNGKRNRIAGQNFERALVKAFSLFYPHVATSRSVSRVRDAEKVDLAHPDELKYGRFPYNVQAKNYSRAIKYPKLLSELPKVDGVINVILHKQTEKKNGRFMPVGSYAIMAQDDFMELVRYRKAWELFRDHFSEQGYDENEGPLMKALETVGLVDVTDNFTIK